MNRNLYRIIFNKARGMLMVVADIAGSGRAGGARVSGLGRTLSRLIGRVGALSFSLWLAMGVIQPASAAIVADPQAPGGQQPTIINSANGTPQINIQTPSAGGVSRNSYSQFDVGQQGAILNNSHKNVQTELGGMVSGNPWLARGEAKVILNEVNSRDPSRLNGFVEVAGQKAQVVIANPSGITCNGCGFINANRATLTTGQAQMNNGNLTGFNVERGEVAVEGAGMDSSRQDYTDIIARSVKINASVWAKDLKVSTGRNQVDAAHQQVAKQGDDAASRPQVSLDVSSLGGMYAGKIRLIGTEAGVGVRNAGNIGAQAGAVTITADGRIENSGSIRSSDDLQVAAREDLSNSGALFAGGSATVASAAEVRNSGSVAARNNVTLQAARLNSATSGILAAGVQDDGRLGETGDLTLAADGALSAQGENLAGGSLTARGQRLDLSGSRTQGKNITLEARNGDIATRGGTLVAQQQLAARTGKMLDNDGGALTASKLDLQAHDLSSQQGQITQTGGDDLAIALPGSLNNRGGRIASNSGSLTLNADTLDNQSGEIAHAGSGALAIDARRLQGGGGRLLSNGQLSLRGGEFDLDKGTTSAQQIDADVDSLSNQQGQLVQSGSGEMRLHTRGALNNQGGQLAGNGNIDLKAAALDNRSGAIVAAQQGSLTAQVSGAVDNRQGELAASRDLRLNADRLDNRQGRASAATGAASLATQQALANQAGRIEAKGDLTLSADGLDNQQGTLLGDNLQLGLGQRALDNQHGVIAATGALRSDSGALNNDGGLLQAGGDLLLDTHGARLSNQLSGDSGGILSAGALTLRSGELDNRQGMLAGGGATQLTTQALNNSGGTLVGKQQLRIESDGALTNDAGLLQSGGDARIDTHGYALSNRDSGSKGGISSLGALTLNAGAIDNQQGFIASQGDLQLDGAQLDNQRGTLASQAALSAAAASVSNQSGAIKAGQGLTLEAAQRLNNQGGTIGAGKALRVTAGELLNGQGVLASGDTGSLSVDALDNRGGQLAAQQALTLRGGTLDNSDGGLIQSGDGLDIGVDTLLNQNSGEKGGLTSQGEMLIRAGRMENAQGLALSGKALQLAAGSLNNAAGTLVAQDQLRLDIASPQDALRLNTTSMLNALRLDTASALNNRAGLLQGGSVLVDSHGQGVDNQNGTLYSLGDLSLQGGDIDNQGGTLGAKGDLSLQSGELDNRNGGRVVSEQAASLTTAHLDNRGGQIQSVGDLLLSSAQGVIDNAAGLIRSGATAVINALQLDNQDTQGAQQGIEAANLNVTSDSIANQRGTLLADRQLAINSRGSVDNSQGELSAGEDLLLQGDGLALTNSAGGVKAGRSLTIRADRIGGDGQILSRGDITLVSQQSLNNSGEMIANGSFNFTTPGDVVNSGKLLAGGKLDLRASNLLNAASGEINAGQDWLTLNGQLTNYGLIDGKQTLLKAGTLTNIGSGRIYGDTVGVQAGTFNNLAENGTAATLAGRERVDIGVQTLNNRDHGLIYSAGDMALGGQLDGSGLATGKADTLNNHSATIESAGDMQIDAGQINNVNDHFSTELATVSTEAITEYQHSGDTVRWKAGEPGVFVDRNSADSLRNLNTPGKTGSNHDRFTQYDYTRTVQETQIAESDPAKIVAGGNMTVNADKVFNDKSQIIAGNTLTMNAGELDNVEVAGQRITNDDGKVTSYYRIRHKGGDSQGKKQSAYTPPEVIETIALKPGQLVDHGDISGTPVSLAPQSAQGTDAAIGHSGGVSAAVAGSALAPDWQAVDTGALPAIAAAALKPGQRFEVASSLAPQQGEAARVMRIVGPDTRLPDNSLFKTNPSPGGKYLVETDPRFTQEKQWLSSDYMQERLTQNSDNVLKRLGDGYYEQRLIREQVINLTGQRYLDGYSNDEDQYKALMNNAIDFSQEYHLTLGVALTPQQMALLTKDIVWLVNAQVRLPDGSTQTVLVPQVYARVQPGDVDGSGALIAGRNLNLNLGGGLFNSGTLAGREVVKLSADNITNLAGTIKGASVDLAARTDINNIGGVIQGTDALLASAGRDINAISTTRSVESRSGDNSFARTTVDSVAGMYVQGDGGRLILQAGRDINLTAAQVVNSGKSSQTVLHAGRDLSLNTVTTASRDDIVWDGDNSLKQGNTQEIGSEVVGKGDVSLLAGNDLKARAATLSADLALALTAGQDVTLTNGENTQDLDERHKVTGSSGWLSKSTTTTRDQIARQTAQGSALSGDSVTVAAGNDLRVQGSQIAGTRDVALQAGNDLSVAGATERNSEQHLAQEKKSGLSGTGGIGFSYGTQSLKTTDTAQDVTNQGSTVGSVNGNVTLEAGNRLDVNGSELIAGKNLTLDGRDVSVTAAENQSSQTHKVEQKTSGLTLALSGTVGSALNTAAQTVQEAKSADSGRLAALQGTKAALSGVQATQAARLAAAQGDSPENNNAIGVSLSYGSQSSTSMQRSEQRTAQGSNLTAGDNLSVVARGSGVKGADGDLTVQGSQLQAGKDVLLSANRDLNLLSAANTSSLEGKNESHGGSLGVGIGAGQGGMGISVSASVNKGKGSEQGSGVTHTETQVSAGSQVTMASGRDTTLQGAQVSGEKVKAEVGRNLTLASEQDSDRYDSKQQSASAGGSFTFGSMTGSASVNASRDRMHSTWQSVEEQTGIFAGRGGFDVSVGAHTQLDGAVIGSTAAADKNRLETGTLGFSDIENHADYKVEHQSAGISTGGSIAGQFAGNMANGLLVGANHSGSDSSTTKAAVSEGAIVIRDRDNQTQDVSGLSRDVEHANQTLSPIFDKEREQNRLQEAQLIGEIGNQAADIARTEGQIAGEKAKRDPAALQAAKEALAGKGNLNPTADQIAEEAYNTAMAPFGTGSALQKGMQAATAAVQGLAGGVAGDGTADVVAGAQAGRNAVENNQLHEDEARQLEKEMLDCKKTGGDCSKAAEKYIEISNKNSQELKATCTGGGITCVTWEELIQADTNVARDENPSQFRLSEKLKDPSAAALVNYLNGADLKFLKDNISSGDRVMAVVMDPTSWPTIVMGGRAILTNAVNNTKEQLIAVGVGAGLGAGIQYGTTGEVKLSDMIGTSLIGAITAGKGYNPTMAWNAAGGYYQAEISGDDPFMAALLSKAGASAGYAAGNVIKVPMDKIFNPTSKQYEWVPTGVWTITKPVPQSQIPSIMGNLGDTYVSGATGDVLNKTLSGGKNEEK
ncbi:MAG: hemagglutinin repeat-containing protein [Pantoea sp.]|uniref:Filamentous hemagglutinin n=1 Tax=Pantoea septica TaxID=472695 RepID=A0ABX3UPP4_9GAMM|nr:MULTISPECIES: hemagglutinin repeat-containing protein [Pantoea]MDU5782796.1 hemagglutinin repeat-containing protein [Pantoea sp.]ORM97607.1 filamentous hemagglutinin [Pantoea septica]